MHFLRREQITKEQQQDNKKISKLQSNQPQTNETDLRHMKSAGRVRAAACAAVMASGDRQR